MGRKIFSTGPMENFPMQSESVFINVLNNDQDEVTEVHIKGFSLNGAKTLINQFIFIVPPLSSTVRTFDVSLEVQYEMQIQLRSETDAVLISVFGKDSNKNLVAAHRLVHRELVRIDELTP
ncbi:hypothetical protein [Bacillus sp. V2I10]|uniref:hypothetical protein n=1 Tax=Bacillus sp. V2I10 TaxID=3042276 RepID=UPI0027806BFE|nr:hypothetical protein [Bacillus sp. V2I10]MDQ0859603.1 hypothetical protein [Bacillus sp. V2I10]